MLDTILFDLDGTLLPMDQDTFLKAYVKQICRRYMPCGYKKDALIKALWDATEAMVRNDGTCTNESRFWENFDRQLGDIAPIRDSVTDFYTTDFAELHTATWPTPLSRKIVDTLQDKGYTLVLATNPLFPPEGVATRLSWVDLKPEDFCRVTTYDNSTFCKPSLDYYREILSAIGKAPEQCRMVGNNPREDLCAAKLGLDVFFVTDHIENSHHLPTEGYPQGSLSDVLSWSRALPAL